MDRTTKLILAAIALGLWANTGALVVRPTTAIAQGSGVERIANDLSRIADCYTGAKNDVQQSLCNPYRAR